MVLLVRGTDEPSRLLSLILRQKSYIVFLLLVETDEQPRLLSLYLALSSKDKGASMGSSS